MNDHCYVGKSVQPNRRWTKHKTAAKSGYDYPLCRALRKYGTNAFEFTVLAEHASDTEALHHEKDLIATYRAKGRVLYNLTDGGEGTRGMKMSVEARNAISRTLKGHIVTKETRLKLSKVQKGVKKGPYSKERMRPLHQSITGQPKTKEHKRKLSDVQLEKSKPWSSERKKRVQGEVRRKRCLTQSMYHKGKSLEDISQVTGYAVSVLKKLRSEWNKGESS